MSKRRLIANIFYGLYGLFVVVPVLLSLVPYQWGPVFNVTSRLFDFLFVGFISSLTILITPFVFLWLSLKDRSRANLVSLIISALVLVYIIVSLILLARNPG